MVKKKKEEKSAGEPFFSHRAPQTTRRRLITERVHQSSRSTWNQADCCVADVRERTGPAGAPCETHCSL
ncbi:hypothetical protein EVAR_86500_1 [Eumeta japonica]|uniref:Uncharacterized protein n=1 Tax=Eumeta variegata TaxID=151549 RepID=A0A4C1VRA1_EUMVA|nr:hypothetical protein EVAR_86500_1 [Eumeta japonica]